MILWREGSEPGRHRSEGRLSGLATGAADELIALRNKAQAAIKDGRFDEAFAYYRTVDESRLEADDFFRLGSVLLARDRTVPGWAVR